MQLMLRGDRSPEAMEGYLAQMLKGHADDGKVNFDDWEAVQAALLPVVKGQPHSEVVSIPWGSLTVNLVADRPQSMAYVALCHLQRWGRTPDQVLSVALTNARRRHAGVTVRELPRQEAGAFHIWAVETDLDYSASTLLLPHVVDQVPLDRDEMYIAVPQRSRLFFIEKPAHAQDRVFLLRTAIRMYEEGDYPVSPFLHVWSGDRLVFATAPELTDGDTRFLHDGGVVVPGPWHGIHHLMMDRGLMMR